MKVLFLEASSGQVVGGSLAGMLQLIHGLDRSRYQPTVVLYEDKPVIQSLIGQGIRVRIFRKRRLPKDHSLQERPAYQRAKRYPGVAPLMWNVRATLTFLFETLPAALRLSRVFRDEAPDIVHVYNGFRGNLDAIVAARFSGIPCVGWARSAVNTSAMIFSIGHPVITSGSTQTPRSRCSARNASTALTSTT